MVAFPYDMENMTANISTVIFFVSAMGSAEVGHAKFPLLLLIIFWCLFRHSGRVY